MENEPWPTKMLSSLPEETHELTISLLPLGTELGNQRT